MHRHATWVSHRTPKINYMDRRGQHSPRAHKSTKRGRVAAAAPRVRPSEPVTLRPSDTCSMLYQTTSLYMTVHAGVWLG